MLPTGAGAGDLTESLLVDGQLLLHAKIRKLLAVHEQADGNPLNDESWSFIVG